MYGETYHRAGSSSYFRRARITPPLKRSLKRESSSRRLERDFVIYLHHESNDLHIIYHIILVQYDICRESLASLVAFGLFSLGSLDCRRSGIELRLAIAHDT